MSTRSGKRIHVSFHENTVKTESEFTKSERKARSKHTKENFDEIDDNPKFLKRNYVAYPGDDEGIDTVDNKHEETTRVLRKNALKERNIPSSTESLEPVVDSRKSVRSTRRTRKLDEDSQDAPEVASQELAIELPKPKKGKKKKSEEVEVKVAKKKSKKKKNRRSGTIIVEDIEQATPSDINKSNMSVDSFHSAAGSPRKETSNPVSVVPDTVISIKNDNANKTEVRKTRSSMKLDTQKNVTEKETDEPRRKKSSVKMDTDSPTDATFEKELNNQDDTPNRKLRKHKSNIKSVLVSEDTEENKNSIFEVDKLKTSTRKSERNATFDKTTPSKDTTFEKIEDSSTSSQKKKKSVKKSIENKEFVTEDIVNTTIENDSEEFGLYSKKRKSSINPSIKVTDKSSPLKKNIRKSVIIDTKEKNFGDLTEKEIPIIDAIFSLTDKSSPSQHKVDIGKAVNTTFEKDSETESLHGKKKSIVDMTFEINSSPFKSANEASSPLMDDLKRKSVINTTYDKDDIAPETKLPNNTFDKDENATSKKETDEKIDLKTKRKSLLRLSIQRITDTDINSAFDVDPEKKLDTTFDKNSKSSLISSDNSMITLDKSDASRISITSDESKSEENILNTTPVLIESSMDESVMDTNKTPPKETMAKTAPVTPLRREGTFTKDEPEVTCSPRQTSLSKTPTKSMSLPSPGFTPFNIKSSSKKSVMNVTRSVEKRRSSLAEPSRTTKVMFCSPVNNPATVAQIKRKVIKSNLKGSNKSFIFDESVSLEPRPLNRKRSYTQSDAEEARVKRKRLADGLQQSVDRLSRPRTSSASAKLAEPTTPSKKPTTPAKKSEAKLSRTKLPNFAALHQKQFNKMESLDECQERKARRAKQLLTPTGALNMLGRISPKEKAAEPAKPKEAPEKSKDAPKKPETPIKSLPTFKSLNPGYTRFGFKLNLDVNPFSIPSKAQPKPKENKPNGLSRQPALPSLTGATSIRREVAKQTVMREKSFTDRRNVKRTENRTVIKGVRTNRRFELQMRMRDI